MMIDSFCLLRRNTNGLGIKLSKREVHAIFVSMNIFIRLYIPNVQV